MKVEVQKSFEKDVEMIRNKKLAVKLISVIDKLIACESLSAINQISKLKAKGNYFRIRIGDYRLGFKEEKGTLILLRMMHRKEIYKYFP